MRGKPYTISGVDRGQVDRSSACRWSSTVRHHTDAGRRRVAGAKHARGVTIIAGMQTEGSFSGSHQLRLNRC